MSEKEYLEFIEQAKGLYKEGLSLLQPKNTDYSILSGCILLMVGLEKLIKHILENNNPLMLLEKAEFSEILVAHKGKRICNCHTVGIKEAYKRVATLFPEISLEKHSIHNLVEHRNFLVHQSGYCDILKIERRMRINVTTITEILCKMCLKSNPEKILGKEIWINMDEYREAYENAEVLELNKRIEFLKRIYEEGKKLPCEQIEFSRSSNISDCECPVCSSSAKVIIDIDIDVDHREGSILGGGPYIDGMICMECGFSLSDPEEIEALLGEEEIRDILYPGWEETEGYESMRDFYE